jgi:ataxin-3
LFSSVEEPTSSSRRGIETSLAALKDSPAQPHEPPQNNFDDEDYEFQRALQASLMESRSRSSSTSTITSITYSDPGEFSGSTAANEPLAPSLAPLSNTAPELDPVAASTERNRLLLQRMRQEQEVAQRELWTPEVALSPEEQAAMEDRRTQRRQQEEEDDIQLQRAIEESEMLARQQTALSAGAVADRGSESDDELQAALKASLEHQSRQRSLSSSPAASYTTNETEEGVATVEDPAQPGPSVEQIRRARLARFA